MAALPPPGPPALPAQAPVGPNFYVVFTLPTTVVAGDTVLIREEHPRPRTRVAEIISFHVDLVGFPCVRLRWYYRPEDTNRGRRHFNGVKEVIRTNHLEFRRSDRILGKCTVHTLPQYLELEEVGETDFFCRFEYNAATGEMGPEPTDVHCKCQMPCNPDRAMIECDICERFFHPACVNMTEEEADHLEEYICDECFPYDEMDLPDDAPDGSNSEEMKRN